jgi:protein-tyrosine-phosphatase
MNLNSSIIFVCEHGAAKSVIAAAYFKNLAREKNLRLYAIARGTHPDQELSPGAVTGLHEDGLIPTESVPRKLSSADVECADRVITFCELPAVYQEKTVIERWDGVPPVSENYEQARDAIIEHLNQLVSYIR